MKTKCLICPKKFEKIEELIHHLKLEHKGISSELLKLATDAHQTKKQLGNYVEADNTGIGFECPHCYEMFSDLERLSDHGKKMHNVQFDPEFLKKLQNMPQPDKDNPPICDKCGANALLRLTIGTPDDMIEKMKKPL